jgi:hypothetical protein
VSDIFVGSEVLTAGTMKSSIFWDDTVQSGRSLVCSGGERTVFCFLLAGWLAYSLILEMEAGSSSETFVKFYRAVQLHVPGENSPQI